MSTSSPNSPQPDDEDSDSLYNEPPIFEAPVKCASETAIETSDPSLHNLDDILDELDADEVSQEASEELSHVASNSELSPVASDDDDWFDSDENKVEVESLASSESSISQPPQTSNSPIPIVHSLDSPKPPPVARPPQPGLSFLTRASKTFYKAFRKPKKPPSTESTLKTSTPSSASTAVSTPAASLRAAGAGGADVETTHRRLQQLLDAQTATLRSARTGFVELQLVRGMTQRTADTIRSDARALLADYGALERRVAQLARAAKEAEKEAEKEVAAKEQLLIAAKLGLAEANGDVEHMRHELAGARKMLGGSDCRGRVRVAKGRRGAVACREARLGVEGKLEEKRKALLKERAKLAKVEEGYRDLEGDWA